MMPGSGAASLGVTSTKLWATIGRSGSRRPAGGHLLASLQPHWEDVVSGEAVVLADSESADVLARALGGGKALVDDRESAPTDAEIPSTLRAIIS